MYTKPYFMNYDYSPAFLANMADRLSDVICVQTAELNKRHGSLTPVKSTSTMLFLLESGPSTLMDIARALDYSHQLTSLRIKPLEKIGLIKRVADKNDKRRKEIHLTDAGLKDAKILQTMSAQVTKTINEKFTQLNTNLMNDIENMIISIEKEPLNQF